MKSKYNHSLITHSVPCFSLDRLLSQLGKWKCIGRDHLRIVTVTYNRRTVNGFEPNTISLVTGNLTFTRDGKTLEERTAISITQLEPFQAISVPDHYRGNRPHARGTLARRTVPAQNLPAAYLNGY